MGSEELIQRQCLMCPSRDPQFSATPVLAPDVIHAQSKDLPRIFRVSTQGRMDPAFISLPVLALSWLLLYLHSVPLPATSLPHALCL